MVATFVFAFTGTGGAAEKADDKSPAARTIVDDYTFFRCHFEQNGLFVKKEDGSWWPREPKGGTAPPEDWQAADYDDSDWPFMPGPFFPFGGNPEYGFNFRNGVPGNLSTICLRTRFEVTDPARAGELKLKLAFRGGVVVYVNGEEIARSHLPKGRIGPLTLAEQYPKEAYVKPNGRVIRNGYKEDRKYKGRLEKRIRHLEGLALPPRLLRKGANVLAIRLQSAPHREETLVKGRSGKYRYFAFGGTHGIAHWVAIGMPHIQLTATGGSVRPALNRPSGLQVYNQSVFQLAYDTDCAPAGAEVQPVRISAARNGAFAGQVVVASDKPISGLKTMLSDFQRKGGDETMPAKAVGVRYPQPTLHDPVGWLRLPGASGRWTKVRVFDAVHGDPPETVPVWKKSNVRGRKYIFGAVQPLWLTAAVPAETKAGTYAGTLTVEAKGLRPVGIPVEVRVSDWLVPPPHQWRTFVDFIQSPESVSIQYKSKMWSEDHWKQVEESLRHLGSIGNKSVYLRLVAKTENGNSQTILMWARQPDGSLKPDFTVLDRYLALAKKHIVKPEVVCLYVWERPLGGGYFGRKAKRWDPIEVTVADPKTGKTELVKVAPYSDEKKIKAFWKPAAEGIRERLKKLGWSDAVMLGIGDDWRPAKQIVQIWKDLMPEAPWISMGHGVVGSYYGIQKVGYCTTVWGPRWAKSASQRGYGWNRDWLVCHYDRDSWRAPAMDQFFGRGYLAGDRNICGQQRGFGRMNADFFILPGAGGHKKNRGLITCRYPGAAKAQLSLRMTPLLWPGPKAPVTTVRLEMIREGLIECEARITIESALLDKASRAKLGEEKAKALEAVLVEKTRWTLNGSTFGAYAYIASDWRGLRARLFDAAAEVNRVLDR
jgi:hypothetical protein